MTSNISHVKYDTHPEWDSIEIKNKFNTWSICGSSNDDVEIECWTPQYIEHFFLNQLELKEFIEFLQSKLK